MRCSFGMGPNAVLSCLAGSQPWNCPAGVRRSSGPDATRLRMRCPDSSQACLSGPWRGWHDICMRHLVRLVVLQDLGPDQSEIHEMRDESSPTALRETVVGR